MEPFKTVVADPPWKFDDRLPGARRGAERNYKCLSTTEICRFPLPSIADDAVRTCRQGLAVHPGFLSAKLTLGRTLLALGYFDEAAAELEAVIAGSPDSVAALRALADVRRQQGRTPEAAEYQQRLLQLAPLDPRLARVTRSGAPVKLTSHEFRVLAYLMHHRTRVVSQAELTEHIYARGDDRDSNTVEVFIARLRRKLGANLIVTVRGLGYRIGDHA